MIAAKRKEKEMVKNLRPTVWLTEDFPLKMEELIPMLDILANKVKAVRRLRELLTTKFPPGTFPVKVKKFQPNWGNFDGVLYCSSFSLYEVYMKIFRRRESYERCVFVCFLLDMGPENVGSKCFEIDLNCLIGS